MERYHFLTRSDATVLLPLLTERIDKVASHCSDCGFDPYEVPYFTHLRALEDDLRSLLNKA